MAPISARYMPINERIYDARARSGVYAMIDAQARFHRSLDGRLQQARRAIGYARRLLPAMNARGRRRACGGKCAMPMTR